MTSSTSSKSEAARRERPLERIRRQGTKRYGRGAGIGRISRLALGAIIIRWGKSLELPLKAIKPSRFNPRHFYLKSSIAELAVNLAKQGQQQAIHVIPDYENPGTFFVSNGGRRVRAPKEANKESVKAIVVDLPIGIESYKLGYDLNVQRDSQTVSDNAIV